MLTLVTGFSKSGKTSLPKLFNKKLHWNYSIYSLENKRLVIRNVSEVKIVRQIRKELGLENFTNSEYEFFKDKIFRNNKKTYREIMKEFVEEKRKTDPYYFVRKSYEKTISPNTKCELMITDFRFLEDYEFLKEKGRDITTIRIFRQNTKDEKTNLDDFQTDFLFLPQNNEDENFQKAVERFPQYKDFQKHTNTFFFT